MQPPPPIPTLFPYTTLFRSVEEWVEIMGRDHGIQDKVETVAVFLHLVPVLRHHHIVSPQPQTILALIGGSGIQDRKSTRLNSSHVRISYAVFCLKKKTTTRH